MDFSKKIDKIYQSIYNTRLHQNENSNLKAPITIPNISLKKKKATSAFDLPYSSKIQTTYKTPKKAIKHLSDQILLSGKQSPKLRIFSKLKKKKRNHTPINKKNPYNYQVIPKNRLAFVSNHR